MQRIIAVSSNVVRLVGDAKAAIWYSQLIYWSRKGVDVQEHDGWIYKTRESWGIETGLTRYEQESVRQLLIGKGLLEECRVGMPARLCFRVNLQALAQQMGKMLRQQSLQFSLLDLQANSSVVKQIMGNPLAFQRSMADRLGLQNTMYLSRLMQLDDYMRRVNQSRKSEQRDRWLHLNPAQWVIDTGLSLSQQRGSLKALTNLKVIETAMQTVPRKKVYIRFCREALVQVLNSPANQTLKLAKSSAETQKNSRCQKPPTDSAVREESVGGNSQYWINPQYLSKLTPEVSQNGTAGAAHWVSQNGTGDAEYQVRQNGTVDHVELDPQVQNQQQVLASLLVENNTKPRRVLTNYTRARNSVNDYILITTTGPELSTARDLSETDLDVVVVGVEKNSKKQEIQKTLRAQSFAETTIPDDLIWPKLSDSLQLSRFEKAGMWQHIRNLAVHQHQVILDELAGALAHSRQPILNRTGWVRTMAGLCRQGCFVPEWALVVAEQREAQRSHQARLTALGSVSLMQPSKPAQPSTDAAITEASQGASQHVRGQQVRDFIAKLKQEGGMPKQPQGRIDQSVNASAKAQNAASAVNPDASKPSH